jgi:hypothetical protein
VANLKAMVAHEEAGGFIVDLSNSDCSAILTTPYKFSALFLARFSTDYRAEMTAEPYLINNSKLKSPSFGYLRPSE